MYSVGLYTLGCKVSQYETEAIAERFQERGFIVKGFDEQCDAYVINTCTVTAESDRKSRQVVRRAVKTNPKAVVAVVGCYSQNAPLELARIDGVSIVIGTQNKLSVVDEVLARLSNGTAGKTVRASALDGAEFEKMTVKSAPRTRAYIKIEDGCDSRCSYCAIRKARGPIRSKLPRDVISECRALSDSGVPEIVLTGIETGAYGKDFDTGYSLADLIKEIDLSGAAARIRLGSLAPELVGASFVEKLSGVTRLAPHFHISMQSGSDKVLALMKRRYNSRMAYDNILRLRERFPNAEFTTDMMVGFPEETELDFAESLAFIEKVGFLDVHVFAYSKRAGTEAAAYEGQIPESVKRERSRTMIELKNQVRNKCLSSLVEKKLPLSVIAETKLEDGSYSAHADNFAEIIFRTSRTLDLRGEFVSVMPLSHKDGVIFAEEL